MLKLSNETHNLDGIGHLARGLAMIPQSLSSLNILGWSMKKGDPYFAGEKISQNEDEDSDDWSDVSSNEDVANLTFSI